MSRTDHSPATMALALLSMTAVQALVTMVTLTVSVMAPEISRELGVSAGLIGVYASVCYVGAMLGSLLAGGFVQRLGAVRLSQYLMIGCALALLIGLGAHWSLFLLSALLCGITYGPATPASSQVLARHTPPRLLSLSFSLKQTGVPLGGLLAGLVVPTLMHRFGWHGALIGIALVVSLASVLLEPARRRFDQPSEALPGPLLRGNVIGPLRLIFSRPGLRVVALATFFFSATQQSYVYFLVSFLETGNGWSNQQAGLALSTLGGAAVIGRIVWGSLADVSGRSHGLLAVLALGMAAVTALTALITPAWPPWSVYALCALFGMSGASWNGVYLAEISRRVAPHEVSRATGGGLFVTFFGVVVAPPLFGLVVALGGSFAPAYCALALATAIVGVFLACTEPPRVRADDGLREPL